MRHGLERMCIIHESIITKQVCHFSIYIHVYYLFYFHYSRQCRYTQCTLCLCMQMLAGEEENNRANEQNTFQRRMMQFARVLITVPMKNDYPL